MKQKSWLKTALESITGKDEVPEPPEVFRALARDFIRHNPEATVADWIELFAQGCREAWRDGYRTGVETRMLGVVELPPPPLEDDPSYIEEAGEVNVDVIVPQGASNVSFTDEQGLVIEEDLRWKT